MPILKVKNIFVQLDRKTILENISFELEPGESLAVIGPNGSGKTVLLKTVLGLLPYRGEITCEGNVTIGYVPQKVQVDTHLPLTFRNLLLAKAKNSGLTEKNIDECVAEVGLSQETLDTPVGHLSGGQFQRCLIAFAVLGSPSLLLFDEPTASIDKPGEEEIYGLIHRLQEKLRLTSIIVSHELSFVYRYAAKVLCLNRTNLCYGAPAEVLTPATLAALYGGKGKYFHHVH